MAEPNSATPDAERRIEAIAEDYLAGLQAGERPDMAAVLAAHPDLAEPLRRRLALVERLFRAGQNAKGAGVDGHPLPADQAHRLKCPHCGNGIQLVEPRQKEVTCLNCGSSFLVDPESTVTYKSVRPGTTIGRFQILELLGRGAFGEVYKARDSELDRFVAVKIPRNDYFATSEEAQRFLREARSAAGLRHPGIVQVHEIAHEEGNSYIVSDYIEGLTLADLITGGRPAFREAAELVALLADALDYAHRQKVIHRDIKPSNILLGTTVNEKSVTGSRTQFVPYLADFGLARRDEGEITVTLDGQVLGTPAYMSPEQAAGDHARVDGRSDVYSLGVVLYELLSGELPFRGSRRMLLHQVLHDEPRAPRTLNDQIPRDLETICLKAMAKEPGRRYRTAAEFADDLRRFLRGDPIQARRVGQFERTWRWCRRNPAIAGLLVLVALSLSTGTVISAYYAVLADDRAGAASRATVKANETTADAERSAQEAQLSARMETAARIAAERQVRIATAERLAAMSHSVRSKQPEIGLVLAVESGLATQQDSDESQPSSHQALLDALNGIGGRPLVGHRQPIESVALTPDSHWLITAGNNDMTIRVWDFTAKNPTANARVLVGHTSRINSLAVSPDSRWLVSVGLDETVRIWDLNSESSGEKARVLRGHQGNVTAVAISPDGRWIVTAGGDEYSVRIWELNPSAAGAAPKVLTGHKGRIHCLSIDSDNHWIGSASDDGTARLWQLDSDDGAAASHVLHGHTKGVLNVAISPDNHWVVTGSEDNTARIWDLTATDPAASPSVLSGHSSRITALAISSDSHIAVTGSWDKTARVWDLLSEDPQSNVRVLAGHEDFIESVAISPDTRRVVTGSADHSARVWDLLADDAANRPRRLVGHQFGVETAIFSADGRWVVTGSKDCTARIWDLEQIGAVANPQLIESDRMDSMAFSSDGHWLLGGDSRNYAARVWDLATDNPAAHARILSGHENSITCVAVTPDNRWGITGSWDHTVRVWDLQANTPSANSRTVVGHSERISAVAASTNMCWLATASDDMTARLWDLNGNLGKPRTILEHRDKVTTLAFSPDNRWLFTGGHDKTVRVWNLSAPEPGTAAAVLKAEFPIDWLSVSPDGNWIVARQSAGDVVKAWAIAGDKALQMSAFAIEHEFVLDGKSRKSFRQIEDWAMSADSHWLATASFDKIARVWDLRSETPGANPLILTGHQGEVASIAISADSRWGLTGSYDKTARLWDLHAENPNAGARVLRGHDSWIDRVGISPDRRWLLTASRFGFDKPALWRWQMGDLMALARVVGRNLSRDEWDQFFRDMPYRKTFTELPIPGDPDDAPAYIWRATGRMENGKAAEALADCTEAIRLAPWYSEAFTTRARIQATASDPRFRDGRQAVADASKACELTEWKDTNCVDTLAAAYAEFGEFEQAVKWQTTALRLAPEDQKAEFTTRLELYKCSKPFRESTHD